MGNPCNFALWHRQSPDYRLNQWKLICFSESVCASWLPIMKFETMDNTLYEHSLGIALVLMLFFAIYFLAAKTPDKPIFDNYARSRRIMGAALLLLAANYSVHLFCGIRFIHPDAAIFLNLSTYFLAYWLFSSALISLLDRSYLTRRRFSRHILYWLLYTGVSGSIFTILPRGG